MKKFALTLSAVLVAAAALSAQTPPAQNAKPTQDAKPAAAPAAAPSVAGNWTFQLDAGQGPMDIAVTLKMDGKKVTGVLSSPMGDAGLEGEFADGKLTLNMDFQGSPIVWVGALKDADNMTGSLSSPMGEIPWVAKRVKG